MKHCPEVVKKILILLMTSTYGIAPAMLQEVCHCMMNVYALEG